MSLVTKEIHTWLSGSDRRVAVLHCKGIYLFSIEWVKYKLKQDSW